MNFLEGKELRVLHLPIYAGRSTRVISTKKNIGLQACIRLNRSAAEKNKLIWNDAELFFCLTPGSLLRGFTRFDMTTRASYQTHAGIVIADTSKNHAIGDDNNSDGAKGGILVSRIVRASAAVLLGAVDNPVCPISVLFCLSQLFITHILRQLSCSRSRRRGIASFFWVGIVFLNADSLCVICETALFYQLAIWGLCGRFLRVGTAKPHILILLIWEQIFIVILVQHGFDIELFAVCQLFTNFTRIYSLHTNINLSRLGARELDLLLLQVQVCLLYIVQGPQRIELDLDGGNFINLTRCQTSLKNDRQQIP